MTQDIKTPQLPNCSELDVGALSASFRNTTTSYKFLWFLAILDMIEKSDDALPVDKIIINMLKTAKPLVKKYRLRFGKDDRMAYLLEVKADARGELPNHARRRILRFVPYRFLTPFFRSDKLSSLSPEEKNRHIKKLAESRFGDNNPALYKLIGDKGDIKSIEIAPAWRAYFRENIAVVRGWVNWSWVLFLESRNLNRPNIARQILPGHNRQSAVRQRNFWGQVMEHAPPIKCLYSGKNLSVNPFALDHYIPFAFIGHNQLWNLHPVDSNANLFKSDSLPHSCYLDGFVELQHTALTICRQKIIRPEYAKSIFDEYSEGLNMDVEKETDKKKLKNAYRALIPPFLTIARSCGFPDSWKYADK